MGLRAALMETFRHFLVYGAGLAVSRFAGFLLVPVYTRVMSVEEYGVFAILTVTLTFLGATAQLGMSASLLRSYYDYEDVTERCRVVGTAFLLLSASTLLFGLALGLLSRALSSLITGSAEYAPCFWLLGATLVTDGVFSLFMSVLRAQKRSAAFGAATLSKLLATCGAAVILVVVLRQGVLGAVAANAVSSALVSLAVMPSLLRQSSFRVHGKEARKLLGFGLPLIPMSLSAAVLASADRYFLLNMSGSIEAGKAVVGIYSLIYMYSHIYNIGVVEPLFMIWLPQMLAVRYTEHANEFYSRTFTIYVLVSAFLVLCLTAVYESVVLLVSGRSYVGSSLVVWMILMSLLLIGATRLLGVGLTFARKTVYSAVFYVSAGLINTALNLLLIPRYGMLGAGIATIAGASILPFCYYYAGQRFYAVQYEWRLIARNAFIFLALSVCLLMLPRLELAGPAKVAATVGLLLAYFPLMILFGVLKIRDIRAAIRPPRVVPDEPASAEEQPETSITDSPTD